jgi:predicted nucleic acid-binding protein
VPETYFFDTSALFKRYVIEDGSQSVDRLFEKKNAIFISSVTLCEVISNLRRLVDVDKIITEEEFKSLKATFLGDVGDESLTLIEVSTTILLRSLDIITKKYVTPLDAVQLATALSLPEKPVFVCADQKLLRMAENCGLSILDPCFKIGIK